MAMILTPPTSNGGGGGGGGGGSNVEVIDNLTSTSSTKALSANQGVVLKMYIDNLQTKIDNSTINIDDASLTVKGLVKLNDDIDSTSTTEAATPNAVRKAIVESKEYVDDLFANLNVDGNLVKLEYVLTPTTVGQTDFEIPNINYDPLKYKELVFFNTVKLKPDLYSIVQIDPSDVNSNYKLVLVNPITTLNSIINIVLFTNNSLIGNLTKYEYILPLESDNVSMVIPLQDYVPEKYVDLLFFNTTKLTSDKYTIEKVNQNSSQYVIKLVNPPMSPSSAMYNLVLMSNGNTGGVDSRFYEGTIAPSNTSLVWYDSNNKYNIYDSNYGKYSQIVVEDRLLEHENKQASATESGHVTVDNKSIVIDNQGKLAISESILRKSNNIIFNVGSDIVNGIIKDAYFPLTFDAEIKNISIGLQTVANVDTEVQLVKTTDFINYVNVLTSPIVISANSHVQNMDYNSNVNLTKGEFLFLEIVNTDSTAKNMVVNVTIEHK